MTDSDLEKYNLCILNAEKKVTECRGQPDSGETTTEYLIKMNDCNKTYSRDTDACGTRPIKKLSTGFDSMIPSDSKWGSSFW